MEDKAKYDVTLENPEYDHASSNYKPKAVLDKIKQIAQQDYAGSKALDYVPLVVQWEAACKAGLIGNRNQLLFCERRVQEFLSLCFIEVSKQHKLLHEQHKQLLDGWYRAVDTKCKKHGVIAYPHDTKQQAEQKLDRVMQNTVRYEDDML